MSDLYVSPSGRDTWSGSLPEPDQAGQDGPVATLEQAREVIRRLNQEQTNKNEITVYLRGGRYVLDRPFALTAADSGTPDKPITYRAYKDEQVIISGGQPITNFQPVTDPNILKRLPIGARNHVKQADLRALGLSDLGDVAEAGQRVELFFNNQPMTLARWPNEGFVQIQDMLGGNPFTVHGIDGDRTGRFTYEGDRPEQWAQETDIRLHGYWFWDWSDEIQQVAAIDTGNRVIQLTEPYHRYGYRPGQRYYALNLLCELDQPGEWYIDRATHLLYFWPPAPLAETNTVLSVLPNLITMTEVTGVAIIGCTLEATRGTAVMITGGAHNRITDNVIRNTGSWAVDVSGGMHHVVRGNEIYQTGEGGILLKGGDRPALIPAGHIADNNHIYDFGRLYRTYRPAVSLHGVGQCVSHNLIHNGPHNAIQLRGNDHVIEYNEIHHVCYETGDVGVFYMGRDWTERGIVVRYNYFHDIQGPGLHGAMAVYLDDAASGVTIFGNVFCRASRAAFIGGGRDNRVENNIFIGCDPSVHVDARGLGWMRYHVLPGGIMPERMDQMPYGTSPWCDRYPELLVLQDGDPGEPTGNIITRNISVDGPWSHIEEIALPLVEITDNLIDIDPLFIDRANGDYRLQADSPAWIRGFQAIPYEKIGLYEKAHSTRKK